MQTATVQMWQSIQNELANKVLENVAGKLIADGLWKDTKGHQLIQV